MKLSEINYNKLNTNKIKCAYFSKTQNNKVAKGYKDLYCLSNITKNESHKNLYLELEYKYDSIDTIHLWEDYDGICIQLNYINDMELSVFIDMLSKYEYFTYTGFKNMLLAKESKNQFINLLEIELLTLKNDTELAKHYFNYRVAFYAKREEEERQEALKREQLEKQRKETEQKEIENKLTEAEQKILNKEKFVNKDVDGTSIILMLFKKYNINVPLRTQGWINKALVQITYDVNTEKYTYSYYSSSKNSTVFRDYMNQLINAIKEKYNVITEAEREEMTTKQEEKQKETDFINNIKTIDFERCCNYFREQMDFRQLLRNGKQKEFTKDEAIKMAERAYKSLKIDNINNSVYNYSMLYNPKKQLCFTKNNIYITVEAVECNGKTNYLFVKGYKNKTDTYISKEVA